MSYTVNYNWFLPEGGANFDLGYFNNVFDLIDSQLHNVQDSLNTHNHNGTYAPASHNHDTVYMKKSGGTFTGAVVFNSSVTYASDKRIKTDLQPIENPLDKIKELTGLRYKRSDSGIYEIGVLADDLEKVFPDLVKVIDSDLVEDGKLKTADYPKLTAVLIECVKVLSARVEELEKKVG